MKVRELIKVCDRINMTFYFYDYKKDRIIEYPCFYNYANCPYYILDKEVSDIELDKENGSLNISLKATEVKNA